MNTENQNKPVIVAFAGRKRAGKSTAANRLESELVAAGRPVLRLSVAAPLKDACVFILDMIAPPIPGVADNAALVGEHKEMSIVELGGLTGRRLMQEVGQAVKVAAGGENVWAGLAAHEAREFFEGRDVWTLAGCGGGVVILDDLRFPEERVALACVAPVHAWVLEGGEEFDAHVSESLRGFDELPRLRPGFQDADFAWLKPVREAVGLAKGGV